LTQRVLFLGDIHAGSKSAISLPEVVTDDGMIWKQNPLQEQLYDMWCEMIRYVGHVDAVVVNGDSVDGDDRHAKGLGVWTTDLNKQVEVAAELLRMIDTDMFYGTQGSNYHVNTNSSCDKQVMKELGGEYAMNIDLDVEDITMHFRHNGGYSKNPQARPSKLRSSRMEANRNEHLTGHYQIICFSHAHNYSVSGGANEKDFTDEWEICGPAWKWKDDFISSKSMDTPDIGYVLFYVDEDQYTWEQHINKMQIDITTSRFKV
jgi:hypothetical protein